MTGPFDDDDANAAGLLAKGAPGDNAEPLSISELSAALKRTVEDRFGFVRLRGELSGVKRAASGHLYCALKDEKAVIDGVMWRSSAPRLAFVPEDGLEVVASGKLTTYPGRSKYQIVIERMEIAGEGALLALLEKNRRRFEAEGLFAPERKRSLPFIPRHIGVVTSPTGAVIRDILHRLADRFPSRVTLWPVIVQGQGAADQIAAAIEGFAGLEGEARPDLLILGRGGGSVEDLWAFNEEAVVRAIAASPIPIISAVGHETDTTLADFAADRRAPTPTAAAEMAVPVRAELLAQLDDLAFRQKRCALRPVTLGRERLAARSERLPGADTLLQVPAQRLDEAGAGLKRGLGERVTRARHALLESGAGLRPNMLTRGLREKRERLATIPLRADTLLRHAERAAERHRALGRLLTSVDPRAPLARGFALVRDGSGTLVKTAVKARAASALDLQFADGSVRSVPEGAAGSPASPPAAPKPARRAARARASSDQPKLL